MMVWYGKKGSGDYLYLGFCIAHTHIYILFGCLILGRVELLRIV